MLVNRPINLIGYPCGAGANDSGCSHGAAFLKEAGLEKVMTHKGYQCCWSEFHRAASLCHITVPTRLNEIKQCCIDLRDQVVEAMNLKRFPIVIGGDHTMAIGTFSGLAQKQKTATSPLGVIWIDAHMDAHTPQTSHSGYFHGMPLACLLGEGSQELLDLSLRRPILSPEAVCLYGIRSFEKEEQERLEQWGVKIIYYKDIVERGYHSTLEEAINYVSYHANLFGFSIDMDAFDPVFAPGTGTPVEKGLLPDLLLPCLHGFIHHPQLAVIEIAEFNPEKDENDKTLHLIFNLLNAFLSH